MMDLQDKEYNFIFYYKRAVNDLDALTSRIVGWEPIYHDLIYALTDLLHHIASHLTWESNTNTKRITLGMIRHQIAKQKILPSVLIKTLEVLIEHRNIVAHGFNRNFSDFERETPEELDAIANEYLADINAIRNLILWFLTEFESGPKMQRKNAVKLLDEEICRAKTIFISYAKEDRQKAEELYDSLRDRGHKPWMDKKDLLGGQEWKLKIQEGIEQSQFFIALMSKISVTKRGFVQNEIKFALDVLGEIPLGQIYFIPVKLDNCDIPYPIRGLQWVDLTEEEGFGKLYRAIEYE